MNLACVETIQKYFPKSLHAGRVKKNANTVNALNRGQQNRRNSQNRGQNLNDQSDH